MAWSYAWTVNGTNLSNYCSAVVLEDEGGGGRDGINLRIPNKDGERSDTEQTFAGKTLPLRTILRYTGSAGTVTHSDGAAGHVYENLVNLKKLFAAGLVTLGRTAPHIGAQTARCKLLTEPIVGEYRHIYIWPLRMRDGSWRSGSASTATGNPPTITVGGDRRVDDPVVTFSGAGSVTITDADGVVSVLTALAGSFPLVVDCGTQRVTQGGSPAPGRITATQPWWLRMDVGSVNIATTVSVTVDWYNRWA